MGAVCSSKSKKNPPKNEKQENIPSPKKEAQGQDKLSQIINQNGDYNIDENEKKLSTQMSAMLDTIPASKEDIKQIYDYEKTIGKLIVKIFKTMVTRIRNIRKSLFGNEKKGPFSRGDK